MLLEPARAAVLTEDRVRAAIGALGGTSYRLKALDLDLEPGLFLPVSEIKDMRRRALAAIDAARLAERRRHPPSRQPGSHSRAAAGRGELEAGAGHRQTEAGASPRPRPRAADRAPLTDVVLRVRPGEAPLAAPGIVAVCVDCEIDDDAGLIAAAVDGIVASGLEARCRPPQILYDADFDWWERIRRLGWAAVYARHAAHLAFEGGLIAEYPLLGLSAAGMRRLAAVGPMPPTKGDAVPSTRPAVVQGGAAQDATGCSRTAGRLVAAVVPAELSLDEIGAFHAAVSDLSPAVALEALVVGREQLLISRDRLGEAEGIATRSRDGETPRLCLEDAKGYRFPVEVTGSGTRIGNSVQTDLSVHLDALAVRGVGAAIVQQSELSDERRAVLSREGLGGLERLGKVPGSTTGHLFRGVV